MFFILASLISAFETQPGKIEILTVENWDKLIDNREPDSVWFILFGAENCPACKQVFPIYTKAAVEADGMISFGQVRCEYEPGLQMRFNVRQLPTLIILHRGGRVDYTGKINERAMVNAASKYIPDRAKKVKPEWETDGQGTAILFTEKPVTPPIWASISCVFQGKMRIGVTTDVAIRKQFGIEKTPTIIVYNKTHKVRYAGKNSFVALRQTITDFLEGTYEDPFVFHADFFLPEEFPNEIQNFNGYCILHYSADLDYRLQNAHDKFHSNKLKYFYGDEGIPFEFMKPEELYIICPSKGTAKKVDINNLNVEISALLDGSADLGQIDDMEE